MPYTIKKEDGKFKILKKNTGEQVAESDSLEGAKGYIWHAEHAKKKKKGSGRGIAAARMN